MTELQVETCSGGRLHERPRRFAWEGRWLTVACVLASWCTPAELSFRVLAEDGRGFRLSYHFSRGCLARHAPGTGGGFPVPRTAAGKKGPGGA